MKLSGYLILLTILGTFLLACSGGNSKTSTESSNLPTTTKTSSVTSPGNSKATNATTSNTAAISTQTDTALWINMPLYPGATTFQYTPGGHDPGDASYAKVEYRYYTTSDSAEKVSTYFRARMVAEDWAESIWLSDLGPGAQQGTFSKNNGQDIAEVWITAQSDGTTYITLGRKVK